MYRSPNFLCRSKNNKYRVLWSPLVSIVVTRIQDLASEFSKFSRDDTPDPYSERERPPPAPNIQPGLWPGAGRKRPGVGTQTLPTPLNFSAVVAPLVFFLDKFIGLPIIISV